MTRVLSRLRYQRGGRGLLILLGGGGLIVALLGPITLWAAPVTGLHGKERADVINTTRQVLLTAAGGLALLTGAAFTTRTFYLSRREQLSDRYTKAISLLASEKITERLGGVYALEHLMIESERDHQTVVEVLAAFVRERAPIENLGAAPGSDSAAPVPSPPRPRWVPRPAPDVDAALTVLRRRPQRPEHHAINMARTDSAALISQRRISEVQTCMEQGSAWPGSSESSFRGRHWMALS